MPCNCNGPVEGVKETINKKQSVFAIIKKGLWTDNPGLCQLLGLCPLLAVTSNATNALGLGIATTIVCILSGLIVSALRKITYKEIRIPIYVVLIASLVTIVRFYVEAYFLTLYEQLGIYLSLIVTNCIIMGRAEAFAGKNSIFYSAVDGFSSGLGFTMVLFTLGSIREIVGQGTFLSGISSLLGPWAKAYEFNLYDSNLSYIIAILPPGGFFTLAFLIAFKNALSTRKINKERKKYTIKSLKV